MPEETPSFEVKNIPKKRKPATRKKTVKKPARPTTTERADAKEITSTINAIYQDDDGRLPDMKQIQIKKSHPVVKAFLTILIFGGILAAAAWVGFFVLPAGNKFSETQVELTIAGPEKISLGATTTYTIAYRNNQKVGLKNVTLSLRYPAGFVFAASSPAPVNAGGRNEWDINTLAADKTGAITITGKIYGSPAQEQSWRAFLNYQPENFSSELQKTAILNTTIATSPFALAVTGPDKATIGSQVEYAFAAENTGEWQPEQLLLTPVLPAEFHLISSTPALDKNGRWLIDLRPDAATSSAPVLSDQKFKVAGIFTVAGNAIPVKATLSFPIKSLDQTFLLAEKTLNTELAGNAAAVAVAVNGNLKDFSSRPDEALNITVNVKNTAAANLNKASVKLTLDAPSYKRQSILNWTDIVDENNGDIKGEQLSETIRRGQITWDGKTIAALAKIKPGNEVNIDAQLPLKDPEKIALANFSEYRISISAELNYTDEKGAKQSVAASPVAITLNSDLKFESRHAMTLAADGAANHAITWVLTNSFHPLKNIKLTADAYGDIAWPDVSSTPAGELKFDAKEKKITWTIAEMPENVDVLALPFNLVLNKKNPTQNMLISKVHVTADDAVTGQGLDFLGDGVPLTEEETPATP